MKKYLIGLFVFVATLFPGMVNAATAMPEAQDGVIKLTEDVTLSDVFRVGEEEEITVDLNGYTITGTGNGYTIENRGTLTIVNHGESGKIVCEASSSSCIRNLGSLKVDGVTVGSNFVSIKNDAEGDFYGELVVSNSNITSTYDKYDTGAIMNWGNAIINNSVVTAGSNGTAVYVSSGADAGKDSKTVLNEVTLNAKYTVYSTKYATQDTTTQDIDIVGGTLNGSISAMTSKGNDVSLTGNVETKADYLSTVLSFASEGANVILTNDLTNKKITVPEGVTLTIPEDVTFTVSASRQLIVNGSLNVEGTLDAAAYVTETKTYSGTLANAIKLIGDGHTVTLLKDSTETTAIQPYANKDILLDLNGYDVAADMTVVTGTKVTIQDNSENADGTYNGTINNSGELTLRSGIFANIPVNSAGATMTIEGGTYPEEILDEITVSDIQTVVKNEDGTVTITYKTADYSTIDALLEEIAALNEVEYTTESWAKLQAAINSVEKNLPITEQDKVDEYAVAIESAMKGLEKQISIGDPDDSEGELGDSGTTTPSEETPEVPQTFDSLTTYIVAGVVSIAAIIGAVTYIKRKQIN